MTTGVGGTSTSGGPKSTIPSADVKKIQDMWAKAPTYMAGNLEGARQYDVAHPKAETATTAADKAK